MLPGGFFGTLADLRLSGGICELIADCPYAGSALLNGWIYGHAAVAILTSVVWVMLIVLPLRRSDKPPRPGAFSRAQRLGGHTGMVTMTLAGFSAFPLYY